MEYFGIAVCAILLAGGGFAAFLLLRRTPEEQALLAQWTTVSRMHGLKRKPRAKDISKYLNGIYDQSKYYLSCAKCGAYHPESGYRSRTWNDMW
jgi:hypothetical protein